MAHLNLLIFKFDYIFLIVLNDKIKLIVLATREGKQKNVKFDNIVSNKAIVISNIYVLYRS